MSKLHLLNHAGVRWICGGWSFFIAENLVITENREWIIDGMGEQKYHWMFNTLSTAACASIFYGYVKYGRRQGPLFWTPRRVPAFFFTSVSMIIFSQLLPALQSPTTFAQAWGSSDPSKETKRNRCPLDLSFDGNANPEGGLKRISRNAPLWMFGCFCFGQALLTPYATGVCLFSFPLLFSILGGSHKDHRLLRDGTYTKDFFDKTSNVPFLALLQGKQEWRDVKNETKYTNLAAGLALASWIVFRRPL